MPIREWIRSANNAIEGVLHAAQTQRHLRYHFYAAAFVLVGSYALGVSKQEFLVIALAVISVLVAEMLNTSIEYLVDILCPEHREDARAAKDVAAGAVLITAFGAFVIGYIVLFPYLARLPEAGLVAKKHALSEISIIAIILVMIMVILLKAYFGKGHPLRGGMPSGHTAVAFSIWVSVTYGTGNLVISALCLGLAVLVGRSRLAEGVHRLREVVLGGFIGAGITLILFLVFA